MFFFIGNPLLSVVSLFPTPNLPSMYQSLLGSSPQLKQNISGSALYPPPSQMSSAPISTHNTIIQMSKTFRQECKWHEMINQYNIFFAGNFRHIYKAQIQSFRSLLRFILGGHSQPKLDEHDKISKIKNTGKTAAKRLDVRQKLTEAFRNLYFSLNYRN